MTGDHRVVPTLLPVAWHAELELGDSNLKLV